MPLSLTLREATRDAHARAESAGFVRAWLRGALTATAYRGYLGRLARVYGAFEPALDRLHGHPLVAPLARPELRRLPSLSADLRARGGQVVRSPAAERYAARIAAASPQRLIAHCYTRHLGDLSGGRMLGRIARRALGGEGFACFDFPEIVGSPGTELEFAL